MADSDENMAADRDRRPDPVKPVDRALRVLDGTIGRLGRAGGPGRASRAPSSGEGVVVIGLGRFGGRAAESLVNLGHEVLGIDQDREVVQYWADRITHVVQADSTNNVALQQLGVPEFGRVVVGIGADLEASVLTVLSLAEVGVREIWAKAASRKHGNILAAVGAAHVVYPEVSMGDRVAHLITSKMLDFAELDQGFALAKTLLPNDMASGSATGTELSRRYGVTVVGLCGPNGDFEYVPPDTAVPTGATIIVAGTTSAVQRFAVST